MSKRRVKQQNLSVTGLFKLAERRKKMDDVFVNHEGQSTPQKNSTKKPKKLQIDKQTQSQTTFVTCLLLVCLCAIFITLCLVVRLFVCLFFSRVLISYNVYLVVHFNCIN